MSQVVLLSQTRNDLARGLALVKGLLPSLELEFAFVTDILRGRIAAQFQSTFVQVLLS